MFFPVLRTQGGLNIQLGEISLGASWDIAGIPAHLEQVAISAFLTAAVTDGCSDVRALTVQQRMLIFGHYLSVLHAQGTNPEPDFRMTDDTRYSDFLDDQSDPDQLAADYPAGEVNGVAWRIRHLTGYGAEMIERLSAATPLQKQEQGAHWLIAAVAYQMYKEGDPPPEKQTDDWLLERVRYLLSLPESEAITLCALYQNAQNILHHFFTYTFDRKGGIIILSKKVDGVQTSAARFLASTALNRYTRDLEERYRRINKQPGNPGQHVAI